MHRNRVQSPPFPSKGKPRPAANRSHTPLTVLSPEWDSHDVTIRSHGNNLRNLVGLIWLHLCVCCKNAPSLSRPALSLLELNQEAK